MKEEKIKKFRVKAVVWTTIDEEITVEAKSYEEAVEKAAEEFGDYFIETNECYEI